MRVYLSMDLAQENGAVMQKGSESNGPTEYVYRICQYREMPRKKGDHIIHADG